MALHTDPDTGTDTGSQTLTRTPSPCHCAGEVGQKVQAKNFVKPLEKLFTF